MKATPQLQWSLSLIRSLLTNSLVERLADRGSRRAWSSSSASSPSSSPPGVSAYFVVEQPAASNPIEEIPFRQSVLDTAIFRNMIAQFGYTG